VIGIFVRKKASDNISAKLFHWASVGLGMVIVMTAGYYDSHHFSYGHINRIVWLLVYSFTPVLFIHFTSSFVKTNIQLKKYILSFFYLLAFINTIILSYLFLNATIENSLISLKNYVTFFDLFFRLFLIICIVIAISLCIYEYAKANDREERKRFQWLLLGFFIGPLSFVIFWVIPIYLTGYSLIPESLVLIFLTAIPITFSIAIVKYRLMDINLIIRRSVLYTIILATIILTYAGISSFITLFVRNYDPAIPSVITALAVVFLLQPVKNLVQKFVDRKFFRVEYDFREEQNNFLDAIKNVYNIQTLAELIIERVDKLLPVEKLGYFELNNDDGRIRIIASKGFELLHGRSIRFEFENLKTELSLPIVVDDKVEAGLKVESADIKVFRRWGMVLVFPAKSPTGVIHGFLVLGAKKSGMRYLKDDIDLLNAVIFAAALATDRIKLQEELIREHLESERLEELNRLKSFFMQTITHDLKTPLTSIKLFVEKLQDMKQPDKEKSDLCLEIIDGESNKLRRLIDNILDYARIEEGMKSYNLKCTDLVKISERAINTIKYQFMINNQILEDRLPAESVIIEADEEAIERAITNLLTNAIKYSSTGCKTEINLSKQNGFACFEIVDRGRGISSQDLEHIFEPFRRVKITDDQKIEGTGLGLAIVKHIVDAHNGKVQVKSEPGKGSTFTLYFPLKNE
jgi:signal transduction histidine kinase